MTTGSDPRARRPAPDPLWPELEPEPARRLAIGATRAFAERGFHATTTRDISERAGMSTGGLYVYFQSKEDLLFQISLTGHRRALAVVSAAAESEHEPVARLHSVVRSFASWHAENHQAALVLQYELGALSPEHFAEVAKVRREIDRVMRETIRAGVDAGCFDAPDLAGAALALLSLCIDVARWFTVAHRRSPEAIGELYGDLAVRMLRAAGGPAAGAE
ncbi:MAG TPA: TetR/AcrR family transcriptional regulator [Actinocrinis sp.]|nr:TetR/AcrR family transcriptional regulator [Actinocrinis sp.]